MTLAGNTVEPAAAPQPSASFVPAGITDPFDVDIAAPPEAEQVPSAASDQASDATATTEPAAGPPTKPKTIRSMPTPESWFNGIKPLAAQPYSGQQYAFWNNRIVFRPALFFNELVAILVVALIGILGTLNKNTNWQLARKWMSAHVPLLEETFASTDVGGGRYLKEGTDGQTYYSWSSGRKNIKALKITLSFKPRADIFAQLIELGYKLYDFSYEGVKDRVEFEFLLDSDTTPSDEYICAVVKKNLMPRLRESRWDVRAFSVLSTEPSSKAAPTLPSNFAFFTESGQLTESTLR